MELGKSINHQIYNSVMDLIHIPLDNSTFNSIVDSIDFSVRRSVWLPVCNSLNSISNATR